MRMPKAIQKYLYIYSYGVAHNMCTQCIEVQCRMGEEGERDQKLCWQHDIYK